MYRLMIDQRNFPAGLRGYSLYLLVKEDVFKTLVSRQYANAKVTEGGSFGSGREWKLETVELSDRQKRELDRCFVLGHGLHGDGENHAKARAFRRKEPQIARLLPAPVIQCLRDNLRTFSRVSCLEHGCSQEEL